VAAVCKLPDGCVLDGEILAWKGECPLPFASLQKRLGRKRPSVSIQKEVPVAFMAYELLEVEGSDCRSLPQLQRRQRLEELLVNGDDPVIRLSPMVQPQNWEHAAELRQSARERLVEGLMLKRATAHYGTGRKRGDWWKWKTDPLKVDVVMIYAQSGHGKRANLYTDYTFAVWDGVELKPVAKAYSGLTDDEIQQVDKWIRQHTIRRFGPMREVRPEQVFELAFDDVQLSSRHRSGVALRFPRIARWRQDKPVAEIDTLDSLKALIRVARQNDTARQHNPQPDLFT